jgi:hypothetical protein
MRRCSVVITLEPFGRNVCRRCRARSDKLTALLLKDTHVTEGDFIFTIDANSK